MFEAYSANEVAMKLPLEVTSLACQSNFEIRKTSVLGRRGFDLDNLCKQFERKAVLDLTVCEEVEVLLCISDGQMAAHCLSYRHYPVIAILHKIKPIHCFDSHVMYIFISSKKRLFLFKWIDKDFHEIRFEYNQSFPDKPNTMRVVGNTILLSCGREYLLINLTGTTSGDEESWCGECRRLFEFSDNPAILEMSDRNLLGFAHGDTLVLTNFQGQKTPLADLRFSDVPLNLVYDSPYVVALLPRGQVEIRSVNPPYLIQSMVLSKASLLSSGNPGYVFVGSPFDVWMLDAHSNIRKNVSLLIADKQFDLAIQIVELSNVFSDENKTEIKRQAALNLFHRKKFEESFQLHAEIKTDVITIIQMFPEFLPEKLQKKAAAFDLPANDKKRALLALGNYLSAKVHNQPISNADHLKNLHISLQVVDTALLKCYLQTRPSLVDSLLRLHNNSCFFEDAESILLAENRLPSLFILYESRKKHEMALELLKTQAQDPESDPFFHGFNQTVTYLQTLGNTHLELIFKYACWVLDKDIESGLEIFIGEESDLARNLDRQAVFAFLRSNYVTAVIPYLEHVIYIWEETRQLFHDALAEYYIIRVKLLFQDYIHTFPDDENIIRVGDEDGELGRMRRRLIKFLQSSLYYSPQAVLLQLNNCVFYEERALLLGRLKHHEQALTIYTSILNDFESAEEYCRIYYDRNDEINSQVYQTFFFKVYLYLFCAFVKPSDPVIAGILGKDLPTPEPDILSAIRVLNRHADKIDTGRLTNLSHKNIQNMWFALQRSISACGIASHKERLRHVLSQRIVVGNASECCKCGKRIGNSAFVRYPTDGCLAHFGCHKDTSDKILS
uniref:CNH domain-containing protein n=1 Tax=Angiostrongylus cantonensis TaxID=6313 RepID=A0A0K0CSY7_ANGCA